MLLQLFIMHKLRKVKLKPKPHQQLQGGKSNCHPFHPINMLQWLQSPSSPTK